MGVTGELLCCYAAQKETKIFTIELPVVNFLINYQRVMWIVMLLYIPRKFCLLFYPAISFIISLFSSSISPTVFTYVFPTEESPRKASTKESELEENVVIFRLFNKP